MDNYKDVMKLLEDIGAFEKECRPHNVERALKIAGQIGREELRRAKERGKFGEFDRRYSPRQKASPTGANKHKDDLRIINY